MIDDVIAAACAAQGYVSRGRLVAEGLRDVDIKRAVRRGLLVRLRHGTYALRRDHDPLSSEQRHRLLARSVLGRLGDGYALSHQSAAILHTGVSFGVDLETVHVTRLDGRKSRGEAGVQFHANALSDDDVVQVDGALVVAPARAVFESACATDTESALVTINAAVNSAGVAPEELIDLAQRFQEWPGGRTARLAMRLADPGCESVGESRSMYMFYRGGLPRPDTQVVIVSDTGEFIARTDFEWILYRHVGEFDGMFKYGRLNLFGDPGAVLAAEKRREDAVRGTERGMSRWIWDDLGGPDAWKDTVARISRGLETSRRLYTRNRVIIPLA
jgi:hypothetical protein